jgi:hypothetical protein
VKERVTAAAENDAFVDFRNEALHTHAHNSAQFALLFRTIEMVEVKLAGIERSFPATIWVTASVVESDAVADAALSLTLCFESIVLLLPMLGVVFLVVGSTGLLVVLIVVLCLFQLPFSGSLVILAVVLPLVFLLIHSPPEVQLLLCSNFRRIISGNLSNFAPRDKG